MSGMGVEGSTQASRELPLSTSYIPNGNPGPYGGGTYTTHPTEPSLRDYENVFGPSARDIKDDLQKYKRHGRWHLPDILKGPNPWLTDRIDGLITDATNSPFTSIILPYKYFDNVDGKIKWNVWSFDEAMASRVPYEAAARTLTQSKRSFAGYAVRHGLAINLEHNFMMTPHGRENFQNQLKQLIGSIQYSNDLDVHMALILAPSYEKTMSEKYFGQSKTSSQVCREFVDLFGFMQKNQNALDILIEESKIRLKTWGGPMPDFLLCNSKLGFQLQMVPERTNYLTQGPDGVKRLKQGPDLQSYRGLKIVHTRAFSLETGLEPRDMLRRRVRVAEYYRIPPSEHNHKREFEFYNEARDNWFTLTFMELVTMARVPSLRLDDGLPGHKNSDQIEKFLDLHKRRRHAEEPGAETGRPFMGRALRGRGGQLGGQRGSGYRGGRLGALTQEQTDYFEIFVKKNFDSWLRFMGWIAGGANNSNLQDVSDCDINHFPLLFRINPDVGFIFTSSITTGLFSFHPRCSEFDDVLKKMIPQEFKTCLKGVQDRVKIWPPFVGWEKLKRSCLTTEQLTKISGTPEAYNLKRGFFRYGIPIPENVNSDQFFLAPYGAYDEPNNRRHISNRTADSRLSENEKLWHDNAVKMHGLLLLTTDVLDILMDYNISRTDFESEARRMVGLLSTITGSHPETPIQHEPIRVSSTFSHAFCQGITPSASNFCEQQLLWTFPDSKHLEAFSSGNLCGGYENSSFYKSCLKHEGVKKFVLNQSFLRAMLMEFNTLTKEEQEQIVKHEPSFFKTDTVQVPKTDHDFDIFFRHFFNILQDRLYTDAFMQSPAEAEYYSKLSEKIESIQEFVGVWDKGFVPALSPSISFSMVTERGGPADREQYVQAFMRVYDRPEIASEDPVGGDDTSERSYDPAEIFLPEHPEPPGPAPRPSVPDDGPGRRRPGRRPFLPVLPDPGDPGEISGGGGGRDGHYVYPHREPGSHYDDGGDGYRDRRRPHYGPPEEPVGYDNPEVREMAKNIEIVVLRPNIEHYMLGIIMGLAGEQLGNTLWGQTELSVYDDSMHGVWGMSYK
jgi:hypothetical protein